MVMKISILIFFFEIKESKITSSPEAEAHIWAEVCNLW